MALELCWVVHCEEPGCAGAAGGFPGDSRELVAQGALEANWILALAGDQGRVNTRWFCPEHRGRALELARRTTVASDTQKGAGTNAR